MPTVFLLGKILQMNWPMWPDKEASELNLLQAIAESHILVREHEMKHEYITREPCQPLMKLYVYALKNGIRT